MNVIVHHPKSAENITILRRKVAKIHAEAVLQHILKLPCPHEQRVKLLGEIKRACREW